MNKISKNITVVGAGYVGMSIATLLSERNVVTILENNKKKVELINQNISPIQDTQIEKYLSKKELKLSATMNLNDAYLESSLIIIATPTNYNDVINSFDTSIVEDVISQIYKINKFATVVIKSTVPIGFTESQKERYPDMDILFSPEFLREGKALEDNLSPSRVIIGGNKLDIMESFGKILASSIPDKTYKTIYMNSSEAESVKLFSNTFLAMRVSFFNELDSFAMTNNLRTKKIIEGVSLDPRVGNFYNNPSFGYGGYCLPKDTKQLLANFKDLPNNIIKSIVDSNETRKIFIANQILKLNPKVVGVYRLIMKAGSDNFRESSIYSVIKKLDSNNIDILVYEPLLKNSQSQEFEVVNDLKMFKNLSDIIIANRSSSDLDDVNDKLFSRDIFNTDL